MKRITLLASLVFLSLIGFSQTVIQCPINYKANNGNNGNCNARLTFKFNSCQDGITVVALLDQDNNVLPGLIFTNEGSCANGDLIVCITGSNVPPAGTLRVKFSVYNLETPDPTDTVQAFCNVPVGGPNLPIYLKSFVAARSGSNVNLKWESSTEINAKEYILQKNNGTSFVDVATIPAKNFASGSIYTYTDINTSKSITEYRLKLVDLDGSFKNSEIRPIKGLSAGAEMTVYPNPSNGSVTVLVSEGAEKSTVQLLDNSGRLIKTENLAGNSSANFKNLVPGMYLVRVTNSVTGESSVKKLSVIK